MAPQDKSSAAVKESCDGATAVKEMHFRGVRKRPWGRYAKIRDPSKKSRVWLRIFDTAEEAAHAYDITAREIRSAKAKANFSISYKNSNMNIFNNKKNDSPSPTSTVESSSLGEMAVALLMDSSSTLDLNLGPSLLVRFPFQPMSAAVLGVFLQPTVVNHQNILYFDAMVKSQNQRLFFDHQPHVYQ